MFLNKKKHRPSNIESKMQENLFGSKFRILNEKLYTITSEEAFDYFNHNPDDFEIYHKGFEIQAKKWPINPNNLIFDELRKEKYKGKVIADLGCGEAMLAQKLSQLKEERIVHSFDLVKLNEFITQCDIKNVPLYDDSADISVFCLSLMGVNFVDFIREAKRILKNKGILIVSEIISRIVNMKIFISVFEQIGFRLRKKINIKDYFVLLVFRLDKNFDEANTNVSNKKHYRSDPPSLDNINGTDILKPCLYKKR